MSTKGLSKATRTYVRREKARIRREVLNATEQQKLIKELMLKFRKA